MMPLLRRLGLVVNRCRILLVDAATRIPRAQVEILRGDLHELEIAQPQGLASLPADGEVGEGVVVSPNGNRSLGVVFPVLDRHHRPDDVTAGETALYAAGGSGALVRLLPDGSVLIQAPAGLRVEGSLEVEGEVRDLADAGGLSMSEMRAIYNIHTHAGPGTPPDVPMGGGV